MQTWRRNAGLIGVGALLLGFGLALIHGCQPTVQSERLNLLVILIDTLRADHLGCYGYDKRPTSPNVDRLATQGTLFENAVAQSSWTLPSAASLLTGLYPTRHQALNTKARLPDWRETLSEVLQEKGYRTGAVVSHTFVSSTYNLDQGFDEFDESQQAGYLQVTSAEVSDLAIRWLERNRRSAFFLFVHYFDPHHAYIEHPGFEFSEPYDGWINPRERLITMGKKRWRMRPEDFAHLEALYDSEIAFTDHHVGRLLDALERFGLDGTTLIVFTADHGEEFMDHGWLGHTRQLYEETVHVPLILRNPRLPDLPDRFTPPVELIDLMPTLLDMLRVDRDGRGIDGRKFTDALLGEAYSDTIAFSEVCMVPAADRVPRGTPSSESPRRYLDRASVRMGRWKLLHDAENERTELYDLASDPGEKENLLDSETSPDVDRIRELMTGWLAETEGTALAENVVTDSIRVLDEETEERLRALGYVQ